VMCVGNDGACNTLYLVTSDLVATLVPCSPPPGFRIVSQSVLTSASSIIASKDTVMF
jgi:hypothetical protein